MRGAGVVFPYVQRLGVVVQWLSARRSAAALTCNWVFGLWAIAEWEVTVRELWLHREGCCPVGYIMAGSRDATRRRHQVQYRESGSSGGGGGCVQVMGAAGSPAAVRVAVDVPLQRGI
jgi:hypothetical protein